MKIKLLFFFLLIVSLTGYSQWVQKSNGMTGGAIEGLLASGSDVYVSVYGGGIYRSTNGGTSYTAANSGIYARFTRFSFTQSGSNLYAVSGYINQNWIYRSTNKAISWTALNVNGLSGEILGPLVVNGSSLFVRTSSGIFRSTNNGTTWTAVNSGITNLRVTSIAVGGTNLYAGTQGGVFRSTNNGATWTAVNSGITNLGITSLAVGGTNLYAGTHRGVFRSTNNGATWTAVNSGLFNNDRYASYNISFVAVIGTNLYTGNQTQICRSTNNGASWTQVSSSGRQSHFNYFSGSGSHLYVGAYGAGVFRSTNNGASWASASSGIFHAIVREFASNGSNLFAGTASGVFRSTNNGTNWTALNSGLTSTNVVALAVSGTTLYAGTTDGLFRSSNNGATWVAVNQFANNYPSSIVVNGNNVFVGTNRGLFHSTNNGVSWFKVEDFPELNAPIISACASAFRNGGVLLSTDKGVFEYIYQGLGQGLAQYMDTYGYSLFASSQEIYSYAITPDGVNYGINHDRYLTPREALPDFYMHNLKTIRSYGKTLFLGTRSGLFSSKDKGLTWTMVSPESYYYRVPFDNTTITVYGGNMYLGGNSGGVWSRPLSELVSPIIDDFTPADGRQGAIVEIRGFNFSPAVSGNIVRFNGQEAVVTSCTANSIMTIVPQSATSGPISVEVAGQVTTSKDIFKVIPPPAITSFLPSSGAPNSSLVISVSDLHVYDWCEVTINGQIAPLTNISKDQIHVLVPDNATSGKIVINIDGQYTLTSINDFVVSTNDIWVKKGNGVFGEVNTVTQLFADESNMYATGDGEVFYSNDNGESWTKLGFDHFVTSFAVKDHTLYVGTWGSGVWASVDYGEGHWSQWTRFVGINCSTIYSLKVSGEYLFAGTDCGIFRSVKGGYGMVNSGLPNTPITSIAASGNNLYAATYGDGIFISTNNGESWSAINNGLTTPYIHSLAVSGEDLFASITEGIFISNNNGQSWSLPSISCGGYRSSNNVPFLAVSGGNVFIYSDFEISLSNNKGDYCINMGRHSDWLQDFGTGPILVVGNQLFASISGSGLWARALPELNARRAQPEPTGNINQNRISNKEVEKLDIGISPNPVESVLQLNGIDGEVTSNQLFDMAGANLPLTLQKSDNLYKASVEHLTPGIYLLRVLQNNNKVVQIKFVKK
jgi:ligand-binding sensor domain-containing protein